MPDSLSNMIQALDLEINEIKKKGGGKQLEIRGGERVGVAEGHYLYRFPVVEDVDLRDETPVKVVCGQEEIAGIVVALRDNWLTVALDADLGEHISLARLIADDSFLIERLKTKLEDITHGTATFNRTLAACRRQPTACLAEA